MNTSTTEIPDICPACQTLNPPDNKFCSNCGKQLKETALSTTLSKQITIYLVSFFLAPFGLWWGIKYLRSPDPKAKKIGWVSIALTVLALLISIYIVGSIISGASNSMNGNLDQYQNLGI